MQKVIITGVNTGLGKAFFDFFIQKNDFEVIAISRKINSKQTELLQDKKFVHIPIDFSDLELCKQLNLSNYLNPKDALIYINNAATINPINKIGAFNDEDLIKTFNINTISPLLISNKIMALNLSKLKVINISSGAATSPIVGWSLYCATKAANELFFKTLDQQEIHSKNIQVFNINPGVINSNMQEIIRDTCEGIFPRVKDFINLKESNKLKSPEDSVLEILKNCNIS
jgi:benzil reductase ((S)-benzoin forming)